MEIYEALKKDHEQVKTLLDELVGLGESDEYRYVLIQEIHNLLVPHSRAEESVFYNSLRALDTDKRLVFHGYKEHLEAEALLRSLQAMDRVNLGWRPVAEKLREAVLDHVEHEESEIFTEARRVFTASEAEAMGNAFKQLKPKIAEEGLVNNTVDMVLSMLPPRLSDKLRNIGGDSALR